MNCSASPQAVSKYPDVPGEEAMQGTAAHWLLETCLKEGSNPLSFVGRVLTVTQGRVQREFLIDRDMAENVEHAGLTPMRRIVKSGGVSRVEVKASLPHVDPELFGRTDAFHLGVGLEIEPGVQLFPPGQRVLTIFDFKYGRRDVSPEKNAQMMTYALAVYREHFNNQVIDRVDLVIGQPRSLVPGPRVKIWSTDRDALEDFELDLRQAVYQTRTQPKFSMGDWCKYCPALGDCPASQDQRRRLSHVLAAMDMGPAEAVKILALKPLLEKKIADAERVAKEALLHGQPVEGYGLFTGVKHRKWRDEEQAKDAIYEAYGAAGLRPPTPAQAEKLGADGKSLVDVLSFTPEGMPEIGLVGDRRAPYVPRTTEQIFGPPQTGA